MCIPEARKKHVLSWMIQQVQTLVHQQKFSFCHSPSSSGSLPTPVQNNCGPPDGLPARLPHPYCILGSPGSLEPLARCGNGRVVIASAHIYSVWARAQALVWLGIGTTSSSFCCQFFLQCTLPSGSSAIQQLQTKLGNNFTNNELGKRLSCIFMTKIHVSTLSILSYSHS